GSGGTTTASPLASTAAPGVASGSPARRCFDSSGALPCSSRSASPAVSQRPSLVIPMGTTSYLLLSMALTTDAAESSDTSCSPLRPPNRTPTRNFFITFQCGCSGCFASNARPKSSRFQRKHGERDSARNRISFPMPSLVLRARLLHEDYFVLSV